MMKFFRSRTFYSIVVLLIAMGGAAAVWVSTQTNENERVTAVVEEGVVRQVVSVSGAVRAENIAELSFPVGGIVKTVLVRKGDTVAAGDTLITLDAASLQAEVLDAQAALASAVASRDELLAGATSETLTVSNETVRQKREALARTKNDEAVKVENALRTLRSSDLAAYTTKADTNAPAPTVSGTYQCGTEGTYTLSVYSSNAASGYSFRLSGLETGVFAASTDQPVALGACGLRVLFTEGAKYHNTVWTIEIPNSKGNDYTTNKNAYTLALTNQKSAIERAEHELAVAEAQAAQVAAPARNEAVARANAAIAQAEARLARAYANRTEATLTAPFGGTIVAVNAVAGESLGNEPAVTLLALDRLELTARVPEVDIGKLMIGQKAEVYFDTAASSRYDATIDFISPQATEIDGVAYYEARLVLSEIPPWIRSGLNADINIIINEITGLRVPKRFVSETNGSYSVFTPTEDRVATTTIDVSLMGNDGYVAITGLPAGTTVVAP